MKKKKENLVIRIAVVSLILTLGMVVLGQGNSRSKVESLFLISATAGGVNLVEGPVLVKSMKGATSGLSTRTILSAGDRITTGTRGKTEILLNPGSYMRIGPNSEVSFISTDLENLQVMVWRGDVMFEATIPKKFQISVMTPSTKFYIPKTGIYRVKVGDNGTTRIEVTKGHVRLANNYSKKLGKSKAIVIGNNGKSVSKFDRKELDSFELWSKNRSSRLADLNVATVKRYRGNMLFSQSSFDPYYSRFGAGSSSGIWAFDSFYNRYVYFPYSWGSTPYGYRLGYGWYGMFYPSNYYELVRRERAFRNSNNNRVTVANQQTNTQNARTPGANDPTARPRHPSKDRGTGVERPTNIIERKYPDRVRQNSGYDGSTSRSYPKRTYPSRNSTFGNSGNSSGSRTYPTRTSRSVVRTGSPRSVEPPVRTSTQRRVGKTKVNN